jgi:RNA polymerase sigma-70 factor (sigma-E family)
MDTVETRMIRADMETVRIEGGRLGELYGHHVDHAFRLAYLLTGERTLAEDLAQDAFVRMAGRVLRVHTDADFAAYLRRTVVNLANSYFRRRRLEHAYLQRHMTMAGPISDEPDLGTRDVMRLALLTLPIRQRTAVVLRYYEDLSESQVAELMKCRPGTVRSLASRGIATLRSQMRGGRDG